MSKRARKALTPEQRQRQNARKKAWRLNVAGKRCLCGQPAVVNRQNDFVCARCLKVESQGDWWTRRATTEGVSGNGWWAHLAHELTTALDGYWKRRGLPEPSPEWHPSKL